MDDKTVHEFFSGNLNQHYLFDLLSEYIYTLGFVEMKVKKSQIGFGNKRQFAWVWLPMAWDKSRPKNSIVLSFSLGKKVNNPQIVQIVEPYPGRFMHHVIIVKASDISEDIKEYLKEAYEFGNYRHK